MTIAEDIAISVLETIFRTEIDLGYLTEPDVDLKISRNRANAINYCKRYICKKLFIPCHFVANSSKKYKNLRAQIDALLAMSKNLKIKDELCVPEKKKSVEPINRTYVIDPHVELVMQKQELYNMSREDKWEIARNPSHLVVEAQARVDHAVERIRNVEAMPTLVGVDPKTRIMHIESNYAAITDEAFGELLSKMVDQLTQILQPELFEQHKKYERELEIWDNEREEARRANIQIRKDYEMRVKEARERYLMCQEDRRTQIVNKCRKFEKIVKRIEKYNQIVEEENAELDVHMEKARERRESKSQVLQHVMDTYQPNAVDVLDFIHVCKIALLYVQGDNRSVNQELNKLGIPLRILKIAIDRIIMSGNKMLKQFPEGLNRDLIILHFPGYIRHMELLDEANVENLVSGSISFHPLLQNVTFRLHSMCKSWKAQVYEPHKKKLREFFKVPRELILVKKPLKPYPNMNKFARIMLQLAKSLPEVEEVKVEFVKFDKPKPIKPPPFNPIDDIDISAFLSALLGDHAFGIQLAKVMFGALPCRLHTFRRRNAGLIAKCDRKIWNVVTDWCMGLEWSNKKRLQLCRMSYQNALDALESARLNDLKPVVSFKYKVKKRMLLDEAARGQIKERAITSLQESNLHYDNLKYFGYAQKLMVKTMEVEHSYNKRSKKKKPKMVQTHFEVANWDALTEHIETETREGVAILSEVEGRFQTRQHARRVISLIGNARLKSTPTHQLENLFYFAATRDYVPCLDTFKYQMRRAYSRKSRIAFHESVTRIQ